MSRARRIVKLAAAEPTSAATWLLLDEYGTWEKTAEEYIEKAKAVAGSNNMSEEQVDMAIATELILLALEAMTRDALKRGGQNV